MKKRLSLLLAGVMAISLLAGCGESGNGGSSASKADNKTLKFGCTLFANGSLDPSMETNTAWHCMRAGISESLFKFDDNMVAQPWLAESCDVSADHLTWTIKLKKDVKFSNGTPMTATKVKESLDWVREQGKKDPKREKGATAKKYLEYDAEVTANDAENTIVIKTKTAYLDIKGNLAQPVMAIINVSETKDFDHGIIATGPYALKEFKDNVGMDLVANTNYWDGKVPFENVQVIFMQDAAAKANALKSGQVDVVENISNAADIKTIQDDSNFTVDVAPGVRTGFAYMNFKGVLANKELRKAILTAIDIESICKSKTIGGLYTAGRAILPTSLKYGSEDINKNDPYKYNVEEAKKILDAAGIKDTDNDGFRELNGKNIELNYVSYESRLLNDFSDAHIQYLKEVGIKVVAKYGSSDDQWTKLTTGEYDLNNNNWNTVPTGDPEAFLANWYSKAEGNYCGYSNAEYDKLYEAFMKEMDITKRGDYVKQMQQILVDDAVMIVDGYYNSSMAYSKNVKGVHINPIDFYWITNKIEPAK
ncbi:MAG: ABC transporter substrate-binding protein [Lachnospiraceae bacterium]|nr:ABC transporter substrate-binding protein [Lachnospiraceae bacterium]